MVVHRWPGRLPIFLSASWIKILFPFIERNFAFFHQTKKIAIGAHIVKSMIMHTRMADMWRHLLKYLFLRPISRIDFSPVASY